MWWMLIPLSPDTLSVDERTDPPHMVLKKQSQTVSSRAYSQRNAYNAVSGSDTMLNRELIAGDGAGRRGQASLQLPAGCSWAEPVLAPGACGPALWHSGAGSRRGCLCQPVPGGSSALATSTSVDPRAGRLHDTPEISAKEWALRHKAPLFCAVLVTWRVLSAPGAHREHRSSHRQGSACQQRGRAGHAAPSRDARHPPSRHARDPPSRHGRDPPSRDARDPPETVGPTGATPMADSRAGTGSCFLGSRSRVCRFWGVYGGGDTDSHGFYWQPHIRLFIFFSPPSRNLQLKLIHKLQPRVRHYK